MFKQLKLPGITGDVLLKEGIIVPEKNYTHKFTGAEIPLDYATNKDGEKVEEAKRSNWLTLYPLMHINTEPLKRMSKILVEPNPVLHQAGNVGCPRIIEPIDPDVLIPVTVQFRVDFDLSTLKWLIRIYLV